MAPLTSAGLPDHVADVEALENLLSWPSQSLIDNLAALDGDIIILGVGGKIGPCLARMAKRAVPGKRIVGVARFSNTTLQRSCGDRTDRRVRQFLRGAGADFSIFLRPL